MYIGYKNTKGKTSHYYPDFVLNGKYFVEVKGYGPWADKANISKKNEAARLWCNSNDMRYRLVEFRDIGNSWYKKARKNIKKLIMAKLKSRKIKSYKGKVHDLTVEETHSYNIEGLGVHNSAAGSLLSWCLDITKIDPIRFNLYFERFLNPERNCLTSNCNVMLKDGSHKNIVDVQVGDPVQTEHGLGTLVQKHERELKEDENVYEIETQDGAKIQLTGCHIVPVFREGKRIEVRVDEILETDQLFVF